MRQHWRTVLHALVFAGKTSSWGHVTAVGNISYREQVYQQWVQKLRGDLADACCSAQVRGLALDDSLKLEEVFADAPAAAKAHLERARIVGGQVAANAGSRAQKYAKLAMERIAVRSATALVRRPLCF